MGKKLLKPEKVILFAIGLISLITTPFFSYDAVVLPRFVFLVIFGSILFMNILRQMPSKIFGQYKTFAIISVGFIFWSLISFLASEINSPNIFFGISGRFNGVLTYLSLIVFMGIAILVSRKDFNNALLELLAITGFISAIYGTLQYQGLDPFSWINEYSPVFGFFGNPNFFASYLGVSATASMALVFRKNVKYIYQIIWMINIPLSLFIISKSKSQQGFLVFAAGVSVVIFLWVLGTHKLSRFVIPYLTIVFVGLISAILDMLQKSPWQTLLYKESVSYRGDFWRAGWAMTLDNPFFGVGLGGYGDYFRLYRDAVSANRIEISSNVDSAHNILLDISSGGGFPLLALYLCLIFMTLISAAKIIARQKSFDATFAGILGAWIAYSAQSLISVSQISGSIWGWVLSGAIIGYEYYGKNDSTLNLDKRNIFKLPPSIIGLFVSLFIVIPFIIADTQFRATVRSGNVNQIMNAVSKWPQSIERLNFVTALFRQGGFPDQSLIVAREAIKFNPRSYEAWEQLFLSQNVTEEERNIAITMMQNLDPLNPRFAK